MIALILNPVPRRIAFLLMTSIEIPTFLGFLYAVSTSINDFSKRSFPLERDNFEKSTLDKYLGTQLGLGEDESYFSLLAQPYDFIDVTDQLKLP